LLFGLSQKQVPSLVSCHLTLSSAGGCFCRDSSGCYVSRKLDSLSTAQRENLKGLFVKNKHPRFEKEFAVSRHQPFGKTSDYIESIESANPDKIAKLVKLVGMLLQTKVYLFWSEQQCQNLCAISTKESEKIKPSKVIAG
jgi:hypothetical protein